MSEPVWPFFIGFSSGLKGGSWGFRIMGYGLLLKAPWNAQLFSERYGYRKTVNLGFGWRIWLLGAKSAAS